VHLAETYMTDSQPPIVLQLTKEQQEIVHRMSGQHMQVLELTPDATDASSGSGRSMQFRWRQSIATGIPRQQWTASDEARTTTDGEDTPTE
jgi:hypothetical protein